MMCNFQDDSDLPRLLRHSASPLPPAVNLIDAALLAALVPAVGFMVSWDMAVASSITFLLATLHALMMVGRFVVVCDLKRHRRNIDRLVAIVSTPTIVQINENTLFTYVRPSEALLGDIERVNMALDAEKKVK